MKKILTLILFLALFHSMIYSQLIGNKLNLYFSSGISKPFGDKSINDGGYITPCLFNNFDKGINIKATATYKVLPFLDIGLQFKNTSFTGWENGDTLGLFKNSSAKIKTVGAVFKFGTQFRSIGFFNRFKASLVIVPGFYSTIVKLKQPIYEVPKEYSNSLLESNTSSFGGPDCDLNLEYSIAQRYGLFVDCGMTYLPLKSKLYSDKKLIGLNANIGVKLKLINDKHFNYN